MNKRLWTATLALCLLTHAGSGESSPNKNQHPHAAKANTERQAIITALRAGKIPALRVQYLKAKNGWAWADVTPLDRHGKPTAEGGPTLLHRIRGTWRVLDLARVPADPKDPLGAEDASPTYVRNVQKTYPGVPLGIFPKPTH